MRLHAGSSMIVVLAVLWLAGCPEERRIVGDGDADADAYYPVQNLALPIPAPVGVDVLFVVDNSNSMDREQDILAEQINIMLRDLIDPPVGSDQLVEDLHVGVVTTDMGTGGYTITTCDNPMTGDNGVLQNRDHGIIDGCQPVYSAADCDREECPWLDHSLSYPDDGRDGTPPSSVTKN